MEEKKHYDVVAAVIVEDGKYLCMQRCRSTYDYISEHWEFPGGKVEEGECHHETLLREIREEMGVEAEAGRFLGVVENSFMQHGRPHAEINLVYELAFDGPLAEPRSVEDWISFEWCELARLGEAGLLPEAFRRLADDPSARFEP